MPECYDKVAEVAVAEVSGEEPEEPKALRKHGTATQINVNCIFQGDEENANILYVTNLVQVKSSMRFDLKLSFCI